MFVAAPSILLTWQDFACVTIHIRMPVQISGTKSITVPGAIWWLVGTAGGISVSDV